MIWLVVQSFRKDVDILGDPWGLPQSPSFAGYVKAFETTPLPQYFLNSVLVTLAVVLISVACCAGAGYAFSRLRFTGSNLVFLVFIGVLVVPAPVLLLPVFLISKDLGILDSYIGLIGPYAAGVLPIGVYLMKTHFDTLPDSYAEAAEIDRATAWQTFRLIMLPLIRPAAATVAVLAFMSAWNEYIYALVAIRSTELFTLPIGVADLAAKKFIYGYAPVFAAMVLTAIPVYLAFLLAQRSFMSSLALGGGVKG
ncbi:carbohydrate ABC transporter permease [Leifsonia sp. NPDC014704]|uniref:carbohydrate ABC transporter permease n=1 Tax=Leifsonia sp. NPDC014704 TaxID=3364123 RepID=UPI0036F47882